MNNLNSWISPNPEKNPDFIIAGAMKSGTSTLHHILASHPEIFIPEKEIGFFDCDNIIEHPDYNFYNNEKWIWQNISKSKNKIWDWYHHQFNAKENEKHTGEDSTTYLASEIAAKRISIQTKPIKILVILRNPTKRAYSQYWHYLRTGRANYNFEDTLKFNPTSVLNRSMYYSQLSCYYKFIPKEQIKVVIFEEFIASIESTIEEICEFLSVDFNLIPKESFNTHSNQTRISKYPSLSVLKNRFFRTQGNMRYLKYLPFTPDENNLNKKDIAWFVDRTIRRLNPNNTNKIPKIKDSTKIFLDSYFERELEGLNELLDKDVMSLWFPK